MPAPVKPLDSQSIAKAYKRGDTLKEIAEQHSSDPRTIRRVLVEAGVTIRPRFNQSA
jgi:hypothetical protein